MDTYVVLADRQREAVGLRFASNAVSRSSIRRSQRAQRETDDRVRFRMGVAVALLPSMALWALIWFAFTRLISNWL